MVWCGLNSTSNRLEPTNVVAGVRRGINGQPLLVNYDTFSAVTSGPSSTLDRAKRYPQLVSFVGQTSELMSKLDVYMVLTLLQTQARAR